MVQTQQAGREPTSQYAEAAVPSKPTVSFVVPVFNDEENIARCLRSIQIQSEPTHECEVVLLDNGSTDRTPSIMKDMGFSFHVVPGIHVSGLRNFGAALAKGEYLAFVDSDVELSQEWLSGMLESFKNPEVVAIGCFPGIPDESTWVQRTWDLHQRGRHRYRVPTPVSWLPSMNLVVRREVFRDIGGFNEVLETAEDVDLCYRLGKRGLILCNPAMQAVHWGEARDLKTFWRKEVWRGMGNLSGVKSHGLRWDEVPSLLYPVYMLVGSALLILAAVFSWDLERWWGIPVGLCVVSLPAAILSIKTAKQAHAYISILSLFTLYLTYGFARGYSVLKSLLSGKE